MLDHERTWRAQAVFKDRWPDLSWGMYSSMSKRVECYQIVDAALEQTSPERDGSDE